MHNEHCGWCDTGGKWPCPYDGYCRFCGCNINNRDHSSFCRLIGTKLTGREPEQAGGQA